MQSFKEFITPKYGKSNIHTDLATGQLVSPNSITTPVSNATGTGDYYSDNWSGYVDYNATGNDFTSVNGTWTVPSISSPLNSYYSSWVGIGGFTFNEHSSPSVMQAGVQTELNSNGELSITPFWEVYPYNLEQPITNMTIYNGDTLYTDITYTPSNGGTFSWYLENETTGQAIPSQSITGMSQYYDGTEAEWILERPKVNGTLSSLGYFGASGITFSSCSTNNSENMRQGIGDSAQYEVQHLEMTSNGQYYGAPLANASSINSSSVGYTDYWHGSN
ncbi:MAG: G1 family endopeptidase [Alicyclobacillaceae bacterium]|nr:G1 family endopeptidase [Alicyclobacillaceae bacterium]